MMFLPFFYLRLALLLLFVHLLMGLGAQTVWPGDANNNGLVNGVDVLYIGWAFGATGPARSNTSTDWDAQTAPAPWSNTFPDGLNFYFADTNGDGVVDENDLEEAVDENFGLTHGTRLPDGYDNAPDNSTAPALAITPLTNVIGLGDTAKFMLSLGSQSVPIQNFQGIALKASVRTVNGSLLDELEFEHEPMEDFWLAQGDDSFLDFDKHDDNNPSSIDVALVRSNQQGVSGSGPLGQFSVIIEDIVVGLPADTLIIQIDSVRLVNTSGFTTVAVKLAKAQLVLRKNASNTATVLSDDLLPLELYPNPSNTKDIRLSINPTELRTLQVVALDGRVISPFWHTQDSKTISVSLSFLPPGTYFIKAFTIKGIRSGKFSIIP